MSNYKGRTPIYGEKMVNRNFSLPVDVLEKLEDEAFKNCGGNTSFLLRRILSEYFEKFEKTA